MKFWRKQLETAAIKSIATFASQSLSQTSLSKDEIRWYLRTNASGADEDAEHIQIGAFSLTAEDAKTYLYSFSTKRRVYNWKDLNVTVWI